MRYPGKELAAAGLGSCIVGFVVSPYIYIAIGALFQFPPAFSFVVLPPLLLASGFLFWRLLSKPKAGVTSTPSRIFETVSLLAVAVFLVMIPRFNLFTAFERIGMFCTFLLIASAVSLPLMLLRDTALKQRLRKLPSGISSAAFVLIVMLLGFTMGIYLLQTLRFI